LHFTVVDRDPQEARGALAYAGQLSRLCHARVTLLSPDDGSAAGTTRGRAARESLGSGLAALETSAVDTVDTRAVLRELDRQPPDLLILPVSGLDSAAQRALLGTGGFSVLLLPDRARPPREALLCTAAGEQAKHDILVAGRLLRHLGARVTLLTAVDRPDESDNRQIARFHEASMRSLRLFGLDVGTTTIEGEVRDVIADEARRRQSDLLVLGSPPPGTEARTRLSHLANDLLQLVALPILVVSTTETAR
jgi:nucleotide-binding universal stress UspA family protein